MSMYVVNIWRTPRVIEPVEVTLHGVEGYSTNAIRTAALEAAGEVGRNFGSNVKVTGNVAVVTIHRD